MPVIEQGIAIPTRRGCNISAKVVPVLEQMNVGDSALFDPSEYRSKDFFTAIRVTIFRFGKSSNKEFVSKKDGDGYRVWRAG